MSKKDRTEYTFIRKWSAELLPAGFTVIPNLLITHQRDLGITSEEMTVLLGLLLHKWTSKDPYPSVARLASYCDMEPTTVRTHIRELEGKGIIRRKYRKATSSEYSTDPLKSKLQVYAQREPPPAQKRVPLSSEMNGDPYPNMDTKEDEANKTKRRKRINNSPEHIKETLEKRFKEIKGDNYES